MEQKKEIYLAAINAKYIHSNLAVYSLKAYAKEYQQHIAIGEFTINQRMDFILAQIYKENPKVLCFSCYIWNIHLVEQLITEYHKLRPNVPIWLGGPEVSYEVEDFLRKHPAVTGIIIGEGEKTFSQLCKHYIHHTLSKEEICGIAYQEGEEVFFTKPQQIVDMNTIPFCYEDIDCFENRIIYYESSRGCPFSCSYCLSSVDKKLRFRNVELVKRELLFFMEKKVPQVKFVDRTFNCNHKHAMEIWTFIREQDNGITNFHFEIAADLLSEEELALIATMRPGLIQLEIGVQSTNETTISKIHRTMQLDQLKQNVQKIKSVGNIHQHLDLIAGLPEEDYATFSKSFDEIYALKPNQLQLGFLKVLKGSYLYEHAKEYEMLYQENPPYEVMRTKWLDFEEVQKIKQVEEMLEVYYNSGQFEVTMRVLELYWDSPFHLFQQLGAFYEKKGYFQMSHSRLHRCEILLEFLKEQQMELSSMEMMQEALTFDLYYRENCKSRPSWAEDQAIFRDKTRLYCKNGTKTHIEPFHYHFPYRDSETLPTIPKRFDEPMYVLFDYTNRNPFTHQAEVREVE